MGRPPLSTHPGEMEQKLPWLLKRYNERQIIESRYPDLNAERKTIASYSTTCAIRWETGAALNYETARPNRNTNVAMKMRSKWNVPCFS